LNPAPIRVRKGLVVALALSVALHVAWTFWPVDVPLDDDRTVLEATLAEMPPPPVPSSEPVPAPAVKQNPQPRRTRTAPRTITPSNETTFAAHDEPAFAAHGGSSAEQTEERVVDTPARSNGNRAATDDTGPPMPPTPALPPRVDLAYKVFLGTQGFMIGDATYRFEHTGDRYRISTVGQARGLAALVLRGTGKIESHGRITPDGLRPHEFALERGSADRREVAFFDWDGGNVVLHDGSTSPLTPPAFDPLTILWQPYFSPPGKGDHSFSVATTRRVVHYTLTLEAEEKIAWRRGEVLTQRWHRRSDDGATDAWFWLAPSLHYIPIKMRVTRTSRGTLEVLLDSIRVDDAQAYGLPADIGADDAAAVAESQTAPPTKTASDIEYGMPGSALPPMRAEDLRGQ
jgi:hypothetical protein